MLNTCLKAIKWPARASPLEKMHLVVKNAGISLYFAACECKCYSRLPTASNNTDTTLITTYLSGLLSHANAFKL